MRDENKKPDPTEAKPKQHKPVDQAHIQKQKYRPNSNRNMTGLELTPQTTRSSNAHASHVISNPPTPKRPEHLPITVQKQLPTTQIRLVGTQLDPKAHLASPTLAKTMRLKSGFRQRIRKSYVLDLPLGPERKCLLHIIIPLRP
jgi:hypothetical protein